MLAAAIVAVVAPGPWDGIGGLIAVVIFLGVVTDGWHALPNRGTGIDDQRVAVFRRIYKPGPRRFDD